MPFDEDLLDDKEDKSELFTIDTLTIVRRTYYVYAKDKYEAEQTLVEKDEYHDYEDREIIEKTVTKISK